MYWIEKMATVCVILPQVRKKNYFSLVFRKINLSDMVQLDRRFNMKKILATVFVLTFLGSGVYASGSTTLRIMSPSPNHI